MDGLDQTTISLIKSDSIDGVEEFLEIILNHLWVRSLGKNLQKILVRAEVESWENSSFLFQIALKSLLTEIEVLLKSTKRVKKNIVLTALDDVLLFACSFHNLFPLVVDISEKLRFNWHLFGNVSTSEDGNHLLPIGLDSDPFLNSFTDFGKHSDFLLDF
jgi:hypothetical protein